MLTGCVLFCMIGNGDGTFNLDVGPFLGGYENSGLALGDFNGDGTIELGRSVQCGMDGAGLGNVAVCVASRANFQNMRWHERLAGG